MMPKPVKAIIDEPAARPSSPSVKFTALVHAVIRKFTQMTNRMMATARAGEAKVKNGCSMKLMPACALGESRLVGNQQRKYRVDGGEDELADELAAHR